MKEEDKIKQSGTEQNADAAVQPDPETLHKTDPQDNMKGPISSLMQNIKEKSEKRDADKTKEEADAERDAKI